MKFLKGLSPARILMLGLYLLQVEAAIQTYNLTITLEKGTSGCFSVPQVLINGMFPGPVIRIRDDDTLVVHITNKMPKDEFTMHWHGLHQFGTPWYDGVPNISQFPIAPGNTYTHRMTLKGQSGTYFYHSHTKLHASTALGALIVEDTKAVPFKYDAEMIVILSDRLVAGGKNEIEQMSYTYNKISQGIMFNGVPGLVSNGTRLIQQGPGPACKPNVFTVEPNKVYRLRIIGGTTVSYTSFAIAGHVLEVVEIEGFYTKPTKMDKLPVHTGQRYSVLLKTGNTSRRSFRIHTHTINKDGSTHLAGVSHLRYTAPARHTPTTSMADLRWTPDMVTAYTDPAFATMQDGMALNGKNLPFDIDWPMDWRHTDLGLKSQSNLFAPLDPAPIPRATKRYYYRITHEEREPEETPRWFVNNVTIKHPHVNLLTEAYKNKTRDYDLTPYRMEHLEGKQVVDIIIQNTVDMVGVCDNHPWHLHGHSFWDMGSGLGKWTPENNLPLNPTPILRDTFTFSLGLPQNGLTPREDCGWHMIRFVTDNPGLWIFHCHILQHLDFGMVLYFAEDIGNLPMMPPDLTHMTAMGPPVPH